MFLVLFVAAVGALIYFNQEPATVRLADWSFTTSLAAIAGAAYVLGMLSGWTMLRMVRRSAGSVADSIQRQSAGQR
jgi:hypothetical protein